ALGRSPWAGFLAAACARSRCLALPIPGGLAARQGRWPRAAALAAGASCVRITGLFLAAALIAEFALECGAGREPVRRAPWLALPFLPLVGYSFFHFTRTGDWLAWKHAQEAGWGREMVWPWEAWSVTWDNAMGAGDMAPAFRMEIAGAVLALAALVWLLALRRWSEAVYGGLQAGAFMTSAYYLPVPRSLQLWFPLWVALARLATRRGWVIVLDALVSGPLMVLNTIRFLGGAWAG